MAQHITTVNPLNLNFSDIEQLFFVRQVVFLSESKVPRPRLIHTFFDDYLVEHAYDTESGTRVVSISWKGNRVFTRTYTLDDLNKILPTSVSKSGTILKPVMLSVTLTSMYKLPDGLLSEDMGTSASEWLAQAYSHDPEAFVQYDVNFALGETLSEYHANRAIEYTTRAVGETRRPIHRTTESKVE